jgi:hypothetical protein
MTCVIASAVFSVLVAPPLTQFRVEPTFGRDDVVLRLYVEGVKSEILFQGCDNNEPQAEAKKTNRGMVVGKAWQSGSGAISFTYGVAFILDKGKMLTFEELTPKVRNESVLLTPFQGSFRTPQTDCFLYEAGKITRIATVCETWWKKDEIEGWWWSDKEGGIVSPPLMSEGMATTFWQTFTWRDGRLKLGKVIPCPVRLFNHGVVRTFDK